MPYKNLILVDNSSTVTTLNREIVNNIIKYLISNSGDDNLICVAATSGGIEYLSAYEDSSDTKIKTLENLTYIDRSDDKCTLNDTLLELLVSWRENDFAGRQIILISDGHRNEDITGIYTTEELFFELNRCQYPVHVLCLDQENNENDIKSLTSISRISGGMSFHTVFDGDDANVEKTIGDSILAVIKENNELYESSSYEDNIEDTVDAESFEDSLYSGTDNDIVLSDSILVENDVVTDSDTNSSVIYQMQAGNEKNSTGLLLCIPFVVLIIMASIVIIARNAKQKRLEKNIEAEYMKSVNKNIKRYQGKFSRDGAGAYTDEIEETRPLTDIMDVNEDGGTRLLFQTTEGVDITLEDRADPTKYFRSCIRDRIVLGRSKKFCDVAIEYDDSVSSKHCELFLRGNDVYVRDLSSANGTVVNQQKVYQEVKVNSGDILKLGQISLFVQIIRRNSFG